MAKVALCLLILWTTGILFFCTGFELGLRAWGRNYPWRITLQLNVVRNRIINTIEDLYEAGVQVVEYVGDDNALRDNCSVSGFIIF